jgi:phosphoglucosamine mutase
MPGLNEKLMALKPVSVDSIDGTRLNFEDGWLLVRPSGTEPIIRITAEAESEERLERLYDEGVKAIKDCMK